MSTSENGRVTTTTPTVEERWHDLADIYDEMFPPTPDTEAGVTFLSAVAGSGRALELGIGTGRVAIPFAARGHSIVGIDGSTKMLARLRAKDTERRIETIHGDMAAIDLDERFGLVYCVYGTLHALLTQEEQLRAISGAASVLREDGVVVIEATLPKLVRRPDAVAVSGTIEDADLVTLQIARHDTTTQRIDFRHVHLRNDPVGGVRVLPASIRYAYPSELDLMARLAGLTLVDRFGDWSRIPFASGTSRHVSVYRLTR
jgi:SAM-dependent methyltransferase